METEPQSNGGTAPEPAADLSGVGIRRSPYAVTDKNGDITATLAAMPSSPEISESDSVVVTLQSAGTMRDATPSAKPTYRDILDYWDQLRGSNVMPFRDRLKASEIAARWPNLVLYRCSSGMQPDNAFSTALRANRGGGAALLTQEPETTALLSQWMLRVGRAVAQSGVPARDRSHVDTAGGRIEYAMVTLPFAGDVANKAGFVLCSVEPVT